MYSSIPPNGRIAITPPSPKSEINESPHEAHPVATSVISPVPNVSLRLPCRARNLILRSTSARLVPKRSEADKRSATSSGVIV